MPNYTFIGPADSSDNTTQISVAGVTMAIGTYANLTAVQVQSAAEGGRYIFTAGIIGNATPAVGGSVSVSPNPSASLAVLAGQLAAVQAQIAALPASGGITTGQSLAFSIALGG